MINFGMGVLGLIALARGEHTASEQMLKQALVPARAIARPEEVSGDLAGLGYVMLPKSNVERARQHIRDALELALKRYSLGLEMFVLPAAAYLLKVLGKRQQDSEPGLQASFRAHPFS